MSNSSSANELQVIIFDVDDTLYPERQFVKSGYHAIAQQLRDELSRQERFEDWLWQRFLDGKTAGAFNDLNDQFHLGLEPATIAQLVEGYRFHAPDIAPFEGIPAILKTLGEAYRLGLLTDGPARMQLHKIKALGLLDCFDERLVILTDALGPGCGKPSPAGFELIATRANVPHAACVYIGDNPAKDFVAPNALGWRTIQYHRDQQVHAHKPVAPGGEAKFVVTSDEELFESLKA